MPTCCICPLQAKVLVKLYRKCHGRHLSVDRTLVKNSNKNQHFYGLYIFFISLNYCSFSKGDIKKWIVVSCHEETTLKSYARMLNMNFDEYLKNSQSQATFI